MNPFALTVLAAVAGASWMLPVAAQERGQVPGDGPVALLAQAFPSSPPRPQLAGPSRRTSEPPTGLTPEIETFLRNVIQTYASASSYRDHGRVKLVQQTGRVKTTTETPMELTFERPNHLLLDAGQYVIAADGRVLLTVAAHLNQFTEARAPERLEKRHLVAGSVLGGTDEGHPELIDFLMQPDAYSQLVSQIVSIGWQPDAEVAGRPCRVLAYETEQGAKLVNYIDTKRLLLLKVEATTSPTVVKGEAPPPAVHLDYELSPVELNAKTELATFVLKIPAGLKRVEQLGQASETPEGVQGPSTTSARNLSPAIVGKNAPALVGKDLSDRPFAQAELQGKNVLLFFWSVAGGQYCLNSIPVVQEVAEAFKGWPEFVAMGVNADSELRSTVKQLMERKKATFRTLMDDGMSLHRAYQLEGVPTFVLIGADGQVKWAKLGAGPSLKSELTAEIEKLRSAGKQ